MDDQLDVPQEGYGGRMELLAGPTGRRRRSDAGRARIAVESLAPGTFVADTWRPAGRSMIGAVVSGVVFCSRHNKKEPRLRLFPWRSPTNQKGRRMATSSRSCLHRQNFASYPRRTPTKPNSGIDAPVLPLSDKPRSIGDRESAYLRPRFLYLTFDGPTG